MYQKFIFEAENTFDVEKDYTKRFLNLSFNRKRNIEKMTGPGVYLIEFKGEIIYIGKYQGQKKNIAKGNIFTDRWCRHLQTLTLRGQRLSIPKRSYLKLRNNYPDIDKLLVDQPLEVLHKDKGFNSSYNRSKFALENVFHLNDENILSEFKFYYYRFSPDDFASTSEARAFISGLEEELLSFFTPQCNKEYKGGETNADLLEIEKFIHAHSTVNAAA